MEPSLENKKISQQYRSTFIVGWHIGQYYNYWPIHAPNIHTFFLWHIAAATLWKWYTQWAYYSAYSMNVRVFWSTTLFFFEIKHLVLV